ncbi:MAG: hypothetical protein JWO36_3125 [Myxococcales bacterium]|nr:hypothetical protein [Myxococcales bacterium]
MRHSDDINRVVHDNVDDSVREPLHLGGTDIGLIKERETQRGRFDFTERDINCRDETNTAPRMVLLAVAKVGGELARGCWSEPITSTGRA